VGIASKAKEDKVVSSALLALDIDAPEVKGFLDACEPSIPGKTQLSLNIGSEIQISAISTWALLGEMQRFESIGVHNGFLLEHGKTL